MSVVQQIFGSEFQANSAHPIYKTRQKLLQRQLRIKLLSLSELPLLLTGAGIFCLVFLLGLGLLLKSAGTPNIDDFSAEEFLRNLTVSENQLDLREEVLERIALEQEKDTASHSHFIAELILSHRKSKASISQARNTANLIVRESKKLGFDPLFVAAVVKYESTFNPLAKSSAGAVGLMQVLPSTGHFISKASGLPLARNTNFHDPALNVKLGVLYLAYLRKQFRNNKEHMLIAYNWGPENVVRSLKAGRTPPGSTIHYAKRILNNTRDWQKSFSSQYSRYRHFNLKRASLESLDNKQLG
jgi:soluble lytic murein transglycosylase-like protein